MVEMGIDSIQVLDERVFVSIAEIRTLQLSSSKAESSHVVYSDNVQYFVLYMGIGCTQHLTEFRLYSATVGDYQPFTYVRCIYSM